jgi:superfamily II DNA/RNA helicase
LILFLLISQSQQSPFEQLGLCSEVATSMQTFGSPLPIQREGIPILLTNNNVIIAAETGSGYSLCIPFFTH